MASSELDLEPDLNKAPPHVEGELLKQNTRAILSYKGWKKCYFIVMKDKLQYFDKRDDSKQHKEPIAFIRMSQVTNITEVVFSGVPKKHHLNCGFSVEAFHPFTQQQVTLNLLTEAPDSMRYWVHALRYIKAYWSKKMIRETVLNEEQERKILERILSGDLGAGEEDELIPGEYTLDEDTSSSLTSIDNPSCPIGSAISVLFAHGSKVKISLLPTDTTSDLLDKEEVKLHLTSSAAHVWLVDSLGNDMILGPTDNPGLFPGKTHKLFALDHAHRVLPIFVNKKDYKCIVVSAGITASQIIEHPDISKQLDLNGVTNSGLFLKSDQSEELFTGAECPCDVLFLFTEDGSGNLVRQNVGKLVIHNKSLGSGRGTNLITKRLRNKRTTIYKPRLGDHNRILEERSEEEEAQSKALDMLIKKQRLAGSPAPPTPARVLQVPPPQGGVALSSTAELEESMDSAWVITGSVPNSPDHRSRNSREFEDSLGSEGGKKVGGAGGVPETLEKRRRAAAVSEKGRGSSLLGNSPLSSPSGSPARSRSKSPGRRLPDNPPPSSSDPPTSPRSSPFQRRNATRGSDSEPKNSSRKSHSESVPLAKFNSGSSSAKKSPEMTKKPEAPTFSPLKGKGPTIRVTTSHTPVTSSNTPLLDPPQGQRSRSPTIRGNVMESINMDMVGKSRSSGFGYVPSFSGTSPPTPQARGQEGSNSALSSSSQPPTQNPTPPPTTSIDTMATPDKQETTPILPKEEEEGKVPLEKLRPFVIDFEALQVAPVAENSTQEIEANPEGKPLPINVTSPNFLKVILLQSSEASDITMETRPMDLISLSGVVLCNHRGVWHIQPGYNFHDGLPLDGDAHTETFNLSGSIKAVYNHTHKRWHVLPLATVGPPSIGGGDDPRSVSSSTELATEKLEHGGGGGGSVPFSPADVLFLAKKVIVTDIGSTFHEVINLFGQTRDNAEKQDIGSDMTNPNMGHLIRGRLCSTIARLLLDGLRPYRLQGIVQDDIWTVTMAFCNAAQSDPSSSFVTPAIDKLILQPINAMKTRMRDNNVKFRTFLCLAMSKKMLTGWLEALPKQRSVLRKYYLPSSFLSLAADEALFGGLYQEMLLTVEPMTYLPFNLSIDFELHQLSVSGGVAQQGGGSRRSSQEVTSLSASNTTGESTSPQHALRANIVIKTHAATGQRSAAGNVISAVWDTSSVQSPRVGGQETMATGPAHTEETDSSNAVSERKQEVAVPSNRSSQPSNQTVSVKRVGGSIFKKISERFQQLNAGGAITGAPKAAQQGPAHKQEPHPPKVTSPSTDSKHVEALYTNICDDHDELSFSKGDTLVVKEQINSEWLICSHGNRTGIVPMNYVKPVA